MKKEKTETTETVKALTDAKVTLEMTTEQRDKVVKILAAEDEPAAPLRQISVHLKFGHQVNGRVFGPGQIVVDELLAGTLQSQDTKAFASELRSNQMSNKMVEILSSGGIVIREQK